MDKLYDLPLTPPKPLISNHSTPVRNLTLWEATEYLFEISLSHLRRLLRTQESFPKGTSKEAGAIREFTPEEIWTIGQALGGLHLRETLCVGIIAQHSEYSAQLAAQLAIRSSLAGLATTALDLGPKAELTMRCSGAAPASEATGQKLLAKSAMNAHRLINQRRASLGEPPLALPTGLVPDHDVSIEDHPSPWPGLEILPGGQTIGHSLDWALWQRLIPQWTGQNALSDISGPDNGLLICDLGSEPSPLMMAGFERADVLFVVDDGTSSGWFTALCERLKRQELAQSERAKTMGEPSQPFDWRAVRCLPVNGVPAFHAASLPPLDPVAFPPERTFWDIVPRSMPRAKYVQQRAGPEALWAAVLALLQDVSAP